MENISLILSDLDGTLFHDDKSISEYTKSAIKKIQKKGILFGISTSRAYSNAIKFLDGIEPDVLISNGGGIVNYSGKRIYTCGFSVEETRTIIKAIFEVCGSDMILSIDNENGLYSNSKEELGDTFWTFNDFSDFRETAMKICVQTLDKEKVSKIAASIGEGRIDFLPFSDIPWYKLSLKEATKEKAVSALSEKINIPLSKIAAFGDDFNDIGMLQLCGKGIAMENAIEQVKQVADEVCQSNENDGVARWIEKNIL